jgi:hypothetical protein
LTKSRFEFFTFTKSKVERLGAEIKYKLGLSQILALMLLFWSNVMAEPSLPESFLFPFSVIAPHNIFGFINAENRLREMELNDDEDLPVLVPTTDPKPTKPLRRLETAAKIPPLKFLAFLKAVKVQPDAFRSLPQDIQEIDTLTFFCVYCHQQRVSDQYCSHHDNSNCSEVHRCLPEIDHDIDQRDLELVQSQTRCCRPLVLRALRKHKGDIVDAIIDLTVEDK